MGEAVVEVGSTANNYQILARLATGGMAEIFLARGVSAPGVERYCVLKRILRTRATDEAFVRMFLDEARLAAQLQHPNVAQVYDIGKLGDSYFFTMEYVHGETVRAVLQRARSLRRDLPLGALITIVAHAAAGLHHAHEHIGIDGRPLHIVHRDVSPSNLMVSYEGHTKVVDFGVAKASDRAVETRSGTVKGKISYLSPEQAKGAPIDRRSDLFSLGIVMWEMLTTERLYKRASDFENMSAIVNEPPPAPSSKKPHIPAELDAITLKLLAKSPDDRFQSAAELVEALEDFASRHGTMVSPSALSRFLRDMFGQRPEPWVEMDTLEQQGEVPLTVTSEPIPSGFVIPLASNVDIALDSVPSLAPMPPTEDLTPFIGRPDHRPTLPQRAAQPAIRWKLVSVIAIASIASSLAVWTLMRDRGGTTPPTDAAPAPVAMPAAPVAMPVLVDAAVEVIATDPALPPVVEAPVVEEPRKRRPDGSYRGVVARCEKQFPAAGEDVQCVVAACKLHQASKARAFFAKLGGASKAKKAAIITACPQIELEPKETKPSCESDPMSCQH